MKKSRARRQVETWPAWKQDIIGTLRPKQERENHMICKTCQQEGKTSRVFPQGGTATLLGFSTYYDEKGTFHSHDPNRHTNGYNCSNGHKWTKSELIQCPALNCEYGITKPKEPEKIAENDTTTKKEEQKTSQNTGEVMTRTNPSEVQQWRREDELNLDH